MPPPYVEIEMIQSFARDVTCAICLADVSEPYTLECSHVFDKHCAMLWFVHSKDFSCPTCRHRPPKPIPLCDLLSIQDHPSINRMRYVTHLSFIVGKFYSGGSSVPRNTCPNTAICCFRIISAIISLMCVILLYGILVNVTTVGPVPHSRALQRPR